MTTIWDVSKVNNSKKQALNIAHNDLRSKCHVAKIRNRPALR